MRKKNLSLALLAMVLVCAISVTGTMAYLTKTTGEVKNTFIAAGGGDLIGENGAFTLQEVKVVKDEQGAYTLSKEADATTEANSYDVIPGVDLAKRPFITITDKTSAPAYLYVKVVGTNALSATGLTFTMETGWVELTDLADKENDIKIYVYGSKDGETAKGTVISSTDSAKDFTYDIIANDEIVVEDNATKVKDLTTTGKTLSFYAYLAQATVTDGDLASSDPATVYTTCFGNSSSTPSGEGEGSN